MELIEKLQYKVAKDPLASVLVLNLPDELSALCSEFPASVKIAVKSGKGPYGMVVAFAKDSHSLAAIIEKTKSFLSECDLVWFAYPKKTSKRHESDLTRDSGWETLARFGFSPVRQISLDDDWSCLRFLHISKK